MNRLTAFALSILLVLAPTLQPAMAAAPVNQLPVVAGQQGYQPAAPVWSVGFAPSGNATLAVSTTSANVAFGSVDPTAIIYNSGSVTAYVTLGASGVTATTSSTPISAGQTVALYVGQNGYLAAVTASGSTNLTITTGKGSPLFSGVPFSGAITSIDGGIVTLGSKADAAGGTGSQSLISLTKQLHLDLLAPLPAGTNAIGSITNTTFGISGTLPAFGSTPTFNCGTGCYQATQPVSGTVVISPQTATSTDASFTVTTGGSYQTILAANASRKGCVFQNPTTATEVISIKIGTVATAYTISPGGSFNCWLGSVVVTDAITATAATTGHAVSGTSQ